MYEKIEDILKEFEKEIPSELRIESAVAIRPIGSKPLKFNIKLGLIEDLNK